MPAVTSNYAILTQILIREQLIVLGSLKITECLSLLYE